MRILVDTNILFSALIFDGNERFLFEKAVTNHHIIVFTDLIIAEITSVLKKKLPKKKLARTIFLLSRVIKSKYVFVKTKNQYASLIKEAGSNINLKDAPILAAGLQKEIDKIASGDKAFLNNPKLRYLRKKKIVTSRELIPLL